MADLQHNQPLISKRHALLLAGLGLISIGAPAMAQKPTKPTKGPVVLPPEDLTGEARMDALDKANSSLARLNNVQGRFLQIDAQGNASEGNFYLRRPGRARFEYRSPNPLLIVADGATVAFANAKLKTVDRAPLATTPLAILLKEDLDLNRDTRVLKVVRQFGTVEVTTSDKTGKLPGALTLMFVEPTFDLRQWVVLDTAGGKTRVALSDVQTGVKLSPKLFVTPKAAK